MNQQRTTFQSAEYNTQESRTQSATINLLEMPRQPSNADLGRINAHAQILMEKGQYCDPTCVAQCGAIILGNQDEDGKAEKVVGCFKQSCGC